MKNQRRYLSLICAGALLVGAILGCSRSAKRPAPEWTKARKIAGKEQRLSHISGLVVDDKYAYVTIGGTIVDQNAGMSGLRKVALDSGAVTNLDNTLPQSDGGGIAMDEKFIYWNASGNIWRISKDGGKPQAIAAENVGIGADIAVDDEKVYWANHGYYSPNNPTGPSPVYAVSKQGGPAEIFADQQNIPHSLIVDEKFVYWVTPASRTAMSRCWSTWPSTPACPGTSSSALKFFATTSRTRRSISARPICCRCPEQVMLVAAHNNDLAAARALGLRTGFVLRPTEYGPKQARDLTPEQDRDIVARDFSDLAIRWAGHGVVRTAAET